MAPSTVGGDIVAPATVLVKESNGTSATTVKRHEEYQYLDLIEEILETGEHRPDRFVIEVSLLAAIH